MTRDEVLSQSKKVLTNKFTGENKMVATKVSEAIGKKFQFKIKNTSASTDKRVAIIPAYFDTKKIVNTLTTSSGTITGVVSVIDYSDPTNLNNAGLVAEVDVVLADAPDGVNEVKMSGVNGRTIKELLDYRMTNALQLKSMTIKENSAEEGNFEHEMELCKVNPFNRQVTETIETSKFYDRYQYSKTKLDIDFGENELEICDDLLWVMTVPAGSDYTITLRF